MRTAGKCRAYLGGMSEYTLRPVSVAEADLAECAALLRVVFPDTEHFSDACIQWQYRDNPDGEVVGFNAWKEGVLAAHYVTIPFRAKVHGKVEKGLLSLNTATHPVHQGRGLFTALAKATYEHAAGLGYGFVIGVANANSTHGFTKKLGFQAVSPLRAMIGAGPLRQRAEPVAVQYEQERSAAALAWRLAHPAYTYSAAQVGDRNMLLSARRQFGFRYLLHPGFPGPLPAGIRKEQAPLRKVWIGLDPAIETKHGWYLNVPDRFRPSPLNLIFKDLTAQGRTLDHTTVRFHAMDFDIL